MLPSSADRLFSAKVQVNGTEKPELYACAETIRVTEDVEEGSSFQLVVALCRKDDGSWPHLDEDELRPWNRVTITVTIGGQSDVLMDGYISDIHVATTPQAAQLRATYTGADASYVMNLEPHCKVWNDGQTFEEIARAIVTGPPYNLEAVVADAPPGTSSPPPSVTQRGTDLRFLRDLARRRGYEFYVMGGTAYFRPPNAKGTPQRQIAINFGERTNCDDLQVFVNGAAPTEAVGAKVDRETGATVAVRAKTTDTTVAPMGARDVADSRGYGVPSTRVVVKHAPAGNEVNLNTYVRGVMERAGFWLKARGALNALRYGAILRSRKLVSIVGLGKEFNGDYYVRRVVHTLSPRHYTIEFEAVRNRTGEIGPIEVSAEDPSSASTPAAAGPGADADAVTVRETGAQVAPA